MPKASRPTFFCSSCGHEEPRWFGRCDGCGAWNTAAEAPSSTPARRSDRASWAAGRPTAAPRPLAAVEMAKVPRQPSGVSELDRVLGGGVVPGSLVLVGGDPGIGKSTLLLQAAAAVAGTGRGVLLIAGEESEEQVCMRAARLGPVPEPLLILCATEIETVIEAVNATRPSFVIVDSIQTMARSGIEGGPGTPSQVRECGLALLKLAKGTGTAIFLVGHVTKEGGVAGPRVLEHMVDAVLYLEGERYQHYRTLRAAKNRFGSTLELGVFEMNETGLTGVANPSAAFLSGSRTPQPGTAVVASLEGTRPILVEVQALVSSSFYGVPQRVTTGLDPKRVAVLLAVLERRVRLRLGRNDVFTTVSGGLRLDEPGTDLGVALAIASSFTSRPVLERTLLVGEIALSGEIRRVPRLAARLAEAAQLGFERAGIPDVQADEARGSGIETIPLRTVADAIGSVLGEKVSPRSETPEGASREAKVP